jgi:hypothetical protein
MPSRDSNIGISSYFTDAAVPIGCEDQRSHSYVSASMLKWVTLCLRQGLGHCQHTMIKLHNNKLHV